MMHDSAQNVATASEMHITQLRSLRGTFYSFKLACGLVCFPVTAVPAIQGYYSH